MDRKAQEENFNSQNVKLSVSSFKQRGSAGETIQVFLSDGSSFFMPQKFIITYNLYKGMEVDPDILDLIRNAVLLNNTEKKAVELLSFRDHSCREIELKLVKREFPIEIVKEVITALKDRGLLNDSEYAEKWLFSRLKRYPEGRAKLKAGLLKKGISREICTDVISSVFSEELETDALLRAAEKLRRKRKITGDKLIRSLLNKGFNYTGIKSYISDNPFNEDE